MKLKALKQVGVSALVSASITASLFCINQMATAHAEPLNRCPQDIRTAVAGGATTCPFAHNVRAAWFTQPGNPVLVYSPVTGEIYSMMCVRGFDLSFIDGTSVTGATRCVDSDGGNAIAYVW